MCDFSHWMIDLQCCVKCRCVSKYKRTVNLLLLYSNHEVDLSENLLSYCDTVMKGVELN